MKQFRYVFSKSARDILVAAGYTLLKSDEDNEIYVFVNQPDEYFSLYGISTIESDILTF